MKVSYNWLKEYVSLDGVTPSELADKLTTAGLEVEDLQPVATGTNLVIGEIIECEKHPDSDHLNVTKVNIGSEVLQIVCGAPNARVGLKVIVAKVGAKLPEIEIKQASVRGIESQGMICALFELGVNKKNLTEYQLSGIEELPSDAVIGNEKVLEYLGLDDYVMDVGLTPNRADCNAMWNMAKEVGAVLQREVKWPNYEGNNKLSNGPTNFKVSSNTGKCPLFIGKVINNVVVKPSPKWMVNYLHAAGIKAINNIVDISNYVMLETGQPLHFYDLSKLPHREITVVDNIEMKLTALDGIDYDIFKDDLLITTNNQPIGIAGIMGGDDSKIDENTSSIFIEAALFDSVAIRNTSRRLNLLTEAAQRFAKGLEPMSQIKAVDRSVQLLVDLADAKNLEDTIICGDLSFEPIKVEETLTHANMLLGTNFNKEEVNKVLSCLDFNPIWEGDKFTCTIPSYRTDIALKEDIDEEIIRLIGFDSLKSTLPQIDATVGQLSDRQSARRTTRNILNGFGISEIVTYTLVNDDYAKNAIMPFGTNVALSSPMSEERKIIRPSLMPSVLECVAYNQARKMTNVNLFEISNVYETGITEERLAIAISDNLQESKLNKIAIKSDFYSLKGIILDWLAKFGYKSNRVVIKENTLDVEHFHPYRSAEVYIGNDLLGIFGDVHPTYAAKFNLKNIVYGELKLDVLFTNKASKIRFVPIEKYPSVRRDIALVLKEDILAIDVKNCITISKLVKDVEIFDVYKGEHVESGYKSIALTITYSAIDHTLQDTEIQEIHNKILENLENKLQARLRS